MYMGAPLPGYFLLEFWPGGLREAGGAGPPAPARARVLSPLALRATKFSREVMWMARISPDETSLRSPVETRQQADAYIRYYAMGENRSFRALARETGVTIGTLSNWGKKFKWRERLEEAQGGVVARIQKRINGDLIKKTARFKAECLNMLDLALEDAMARISSGDLKIDSVKDLVSVVKTSLLLRGEVTERRETKKDEAQDRAKKILDMVRSGDSTVLLPVYEGPRGTSEGDAGPDADGEDADEDAILSEMLGGDG